jgi:DNA modification methylase
METDVPRLVTRRVSLDALHLDPSNARHHPDENLDAIVGSLQRFGQAEPLVVQKATGRIIGGNGRWVAMRKLGWTEAEVVELDVDDLTATALGIALNRTGELATWDGPTLARLLQELKDEGALDGVGYSATDLDQLLDEIQADLGAGEIQEDEVPEPPDAATTRPGDLWVLGDHRLLCGDSASTEDVDRLLAGAPIHLINTDPPYNVRVEPRSNNAIAAGLSSFKGSTHHQKLDLARHPEKAKATSKKLRPKDRPLANDFVSDEAFDEMLLAWFGNMARVLLPGRGFYIWGGYSNLANYPRPLSASGLYFSQAIIWVKEHPVLTRKDFLGNFELAYYGWKEGAAHVFLGPNNIVDVWSVRKVSSHASVHLTEKPVELAARALLYSSRKGENVLDLFGGSGSTLIAAEQTGRKAFLMELDSLYSDVIVMRWENLTRRKAILDGDGRSFEEIRAERLSSKEGEPCSTG